MDNLPLIISLLSQFVPQIKEIIDVYEWRYVIFVVCCIGISILYWRDLKRILTNWSFGRTYELCFEEECSEISPNESLTDHHAFLIWLSNKICEIKDNSFIMTFTFNDFKENIIRYVFVPKTPTKVHGKGYNYIVWSEYVKPLFNNGYKTQEGRLYLYVKTKCPSNKLLEIMNDILQDIQKENREKASKGIKICTMRPKRSPVPSHMRVFYPSSPYSVSRYNIDEVQMNSSLRHTLKAEIKSFQERQKLAVCLYGKYGTGKSIVCVNTLTTMLSKNTIVSFDFSNKGNTIEWFEWLIKDHAYSCVFLLEEFEKQLHNLECIWEQAQKSSDSEKKSNEQEKVEQMYSRIGDILSRILTLSQSIETPPGFALIMVVNYPDKVEEFAAKYINGSNAFFANGRINQIYVPLCDKQSIKEYVKQKYACSNETWNKYCDIIYDNTWSWRDLEHYRFRYDNVEDFLTQLSET